MYGRKLIIFAIVAMTMMDVAVSQNQKYSANGVEFVMVKVDGGNFTMGNKSRRGKEKYKKERPAHNVTVASYYIGETEVTQALWTAVMGSNPSNFVGDNRPVEQVSWSDAQLFIEKLNRLTGMNFRLPTEAEWEFAARGGNYCKGHKFSGGSSIAKVGWCAENSGMETHDVKSRDANELGIYDMSGNVAEWCNDWKGPYDSSIKVNPQGADMGIYRVLRGGSWVDNAFQCRIIARDSAKPEYAYKGNGLRLVLSCNK